jgi:hypothetical protein
MLHSMSTPQQATEGIHRSMLAMMVREVSGVVGNRQQQQAGQLQLSIGK